MCGADLRFDLEHQLAVIRRYDPRHREIRIDPRHVKQPLDLEVRDRRTLVRIRELQDLLRAILACREKILVALAGEWLEAGLDAVMFAQELGCLLFRERR